MEPTTLPEIWDVVLKDYRFL
jgi:mitogen-activated protein kinase 1/3